MMIYLNDMMNKFVYVWTLCLRVIIYTNTHIYKNMAIKKMVIKR